MNEQETYNLIVKVLSGEASEQERRHLDRWRKDDAQHEALFSSVSIIWNNASLSKEETDTEAAWQKVQSQIAPPKPFTISRNNFLRIAAAFILVSFVAVTYYMMQGTTTTVVRTAQHETREVTLPDGSKVTLNQNSRIAFADKMGDERSIELEGEAFFDVVRMPERPFIIHSNRTETRVLGTSFIVRSYKNDSADLLNVFTGRVQFTSLSTRKSVEAIAGEAAFATVSEVEKSPDNRNNALAWKTKKLAFKDSELKDVFYAMEQYFDVRIEVTNKAVLACHFTGEFNDPALEDVLMALGKTLHLGYQRSDKMIRITGEGCSQ